MARKPTTNGAGQPTPVGETIPDFHKLGPSAELVLHSFAIKSSPKTGPFLELHFDRFNEVVPDETAWPPFLSSLRSPAVEGVDGGAPLATTRDPHLPGKFEVRAGPDIADLDPDVLLVVVRAGTFRRVKVTAKEKALRIRWTFRLKPEANELGDLYLALGNKVRVKFIPNQLPLPIAKPRVTDLPPEA